MNKVTNASNYDASSGYYNSPHYKSEEGNKPYSGKWINWSGEFKINKTTGEKELYQGIIEKVFNSIFLIIMGLVMLGMFLGGILALITFVFGTLASFVELWWLVIPGVLIYAAYLIISNKRNDKS